MALTKWTPEVLATIPDDMLRSEIARRNARKRKGYSGGVFWRKHNATTKRCRCRFCMTKRSKKV